MGEPDDFVSRNPADRGRPVRILRLAVAAAQEICFEGLIADAISVEKRPVMQSFAHQGVGDAEHQGHISARLGRMPLGLDFARQVVPQRADQMELGASASCSTEPGECNMLTRSTATDIVVFERHAAKGEHQSAFFDELVPADVVARHDLLRADDMRQDYGCRTRTVAVDGADIAARHVEEAMQLARRIMKTPSARPAVGAPENRAGAVCVVDPSQFRRDEIERPRPCDRVELIAPAPTIGAGTLFEPTVADHRFRDPRPVRYRRGDIAEDRRWCGISRMGLDLDAPVAHAYREGAPMRAVRQDLSLVHRPQCHRVGSMR